MPGFGIAASPLTGYLAGDAAASGRQVPTAFRERARTHGGALPVVGRMNQSSKTGAKAARQREKTIPRGAA